MQVYHASELTGRTESRSTGSRSTQLYPNAGAAQGLLALDLLELEPGAELPQVGLPEERVMFVLSGTGELGGGTAQGPTVTLRRDTIVHLGQNESCTLRNTGSEPLRVLLSSSTLVRSSRALGVQPAPAQPAAPPPEPARGAPARHEPPRAAAQIRENRPEPEPQPERAAPPAQPAPAVVVPTAQPDEDGAPPIDITKLMKRGSEVAAEPRPERRKPQPEPEPAPVVEPPQDATADEEEEEPASNLMELNVVFDGGSRGNPGQGYGSYLVQSPNRKPVIKRVEFGDNYTNNQAEYDTLIECLVYIIERLEVTNRSPKQVQLDIKTDSDLVVNQLLGSFKVKDAGLKVRHAKASDLLEQFGEWQITWHPREESVKLLGH